MRRIDEAREKGSTTLDRGQSSVIGVVLVLGMVLVGASVVVTLGAAALDDTRTHSELQRAEHSLTLFNSRASMVALGDSPSQTVSFGQDGGSFETTTEKSWLRIRHVNYTNSGDDETIFNKSLGTVVYRNDGTEIAYQGGGVWRQDRQGEARMVSPPEFHYRGATLTLPIVRVHDADEGGSGSTAEITRVNDTRRVFPNSTSATGNGVGAPYDVGGDDYVNPVENGTVNVTVKSPYYEGWADYFRSNTDGDVRVFPADNRVRVSLISLGGSIGEFEMPSEGTALEIRGMGEDHPINEYNMTLASDNHLNNMHWSFYADEGNEQFELHFYSDDKCTGGSYDGNLDVSIYYYNSSGSDTIHEEWQNTSLNDDYEVDCSTGELTVDLMGSTPMEYDDISMTGSDNKWHFGPEISSRSVPTSTTSFTSHGPDSGNYSKTQTEDLGFLVNHYLQLLGPRYDLTVADGPGGSSRIDESASSGTLEFDTTTGEQYVTYLHVTENEINVTFR